MKFDYDVIVIGGGAAGLVSSGILAHLGARVCLVERSELGGECLHTGCVPSKALLAAAKAWQQASRLPQFGLPELERPPVDLRRVMAGVHEVVGGIQAHEIPEVVKAEHVEEVLFGAARFLDPHTVEVGGRPLTAKKFVVCTGSRPAIPPIPGLDSVPFLTNESIFDLAVLPEHLAVLGAGPIGLEMAQAFRRLGAKVTVVEMADRILVNDDPELTSRLTGLLEEEGIEFRVDTMATAVTAQGDALSLTLKRGEEISTLSASHLLVAAGRRPNVENLGLDAAGVRVGRTGVDIDGSFRTSARNIWALGDVNGKFPFSHMAEAEGRAAARSIAFGLPARFDPKRVAWSTFTDPELASVGSSEEEARRRHRRVRVLRFSLEHVDRAIADRQVNGQLKVIVTGLTGRVIGAQLLAPGASDLLQEWIIAVDRGLKVSHISNAIHIYPGYGLLNQRAADSFFRTFSENPKVRRLVQTAYRWFG